MTKLERRDRRRARVVANVLIDALDPSGPVSPLAQIVPFIAAALKREREETSLRAVGYFFGSASAKRRAEASDAIIGEQKKGKR